MHSNNRRRKIRSIDVTNYKNGINYECDHCGYVCHGVRGARLHLKYTHGIEKKNIVTEQFCARCNKVFTGSVSDHMIRHREEI